MNNGAATPSPAGRARRGRTAPGFNMTAMIDVVFNLLVFFVACSTFVEPEGWLASRLPREGPVGPRALPPPTPVTVRLDPAAEPDGCTLWIDRYPREIRGFDELRGALAEIRAANAGLDVPVVLRVARRVRWQHAVDAFQQATSAAFDEIAFGDP